MSLAPIDVSFLQRATFAALGALALLAVGSESNAQDLRVAKIEQTQPIAAGRNREFYGRVVAVETVDLAFQVGGQVIQFPIVEGAAIDAGTLIAALDPVPFELALAQATAQYNQALRTLERLEKLRGSSVSQASVDDARTSLELTKVQVDQAQRALDQAQLTAPFDALVSSRLVANQSTVSAGTPVVRLHNMSETRIEISVPEILFQKAGRDPDVDLFAKFPASQEHYPVEPREYNAETAAIGQTYTITLGMAPPPNMTILPGSSVVVEARFNGVEEHVTVPRAALVFSSDGTPQVMTFEPTDENTGVTKLVPVEIAPNEHGDVVVTSGLELGQAYVAAGATKLQDGQTVRRFKGFGE